MSVNPSTVPGPRGSGPRGSGPRGRGFPKEEESEFFEKVVFINRCAKVVKGGRRFSFAALVVVGDQNGRVGFGYGKAKMVPEAIRKGTDQARKTMKPVSLSGDTIPHRVLGKADGGKVLLLPARPGTGVIAGGGVRAVLEAAGVKNILSKSLGSSNHLAVVTATMDGLEQLRTAERISAIRGEEVKGHPMTVTAEISIPAETVTSDDENTSEEPKTVEQSIDKEPVVQESISGADEPTVPETAITEENSQ